MKVLALLLAKIKTGKIRCTYENGINIHHFSFPFKRFFFKEVIITFGLTDISCEMFHWHQSDILMNAMPLEKYHFYEVFYFQSQIERIIRNVKKLLLLFS